MSDQESCEESEAGSSDAEYQPGQSAEAGEMEENEQDEEKEAAREEAEPKEKVIKWPRLTWRVIKDWNLEEIDKEDDLLDSHDVSE